MSTIYILVAYGGHYDEAWETNLIASHSRDEMESLIEILLTHKAVYQAAEDEYKGKFAAHMEQWLQAHPEPAVLNIPRPPKPKHPEIPALLKGLSKRERKDNPLQKEWKQTLHNFEVDSVSWARIDSEYHKAEWADHKAWWALKEEESDRFRAEHFHPESRIPKKYEGVLKADQSSIIKRPRITH